MGGNYFALAIENPHTVTQNNWISFMLSFFIPLVNILCIPAQVLQILQLMMHL